MITHMPYKIKGLFWPEQTPIYFNRNKFKTHIWQNVIKVCNSFAFSKLINKFFSFDYMISKRCDVSSGRKLDTKWTKFQQQNRTHLYKITGMILIGSMGRKTVCHTLNFSIHAQTNTHTHTQTAYQNCWLPFIPLWFPNILKLEISSLFAMWTIWLVSVISNVSLLFTYFLSIELWKKWRCLESNSKCIIRCSFSH